MWLEKKFIDKMKFHLEKTERILKCKVDNPIKMGYKWQDKNNFYVNLIQFILEIKRNKELIGICRKV